MGLIHQQKGETDKALEYYNESLKLHKEIKNKKGEADQLGNIGLIYQQKGEYDKSIAYFGDVLRLHRQTGNQMGAETGMVNIGIIYRKTGELEKVMEYQRNAFKIFTAGRKKAIEISQANIAKIQDMMVIRRVD